MIDLIAALIKLDRFKWYRKYRGGIWYNTLDLPFGPGPFDVWWHNERPICGHFLIKVESYV